MRSRPSLLLAATAPGLVIATLVPNAHAACANPVADGRNSVVDCRPLGREQAFVVPAGVRSLRVVAVGASGGAGAATFGIPGAGGAGGVASAELAVKPGTRLYVLVGGLGRSATGGAAGGFNGGGRGGSGRSAGGGGGGASDVRTCSVSGGTCNSLASRLLVAAGGGGGAGGGDLYSARAAGSGGSATAGGAGGAGGGTGPGAGATAATGGAGAAGAGAGGLGAGGNGAAGVEAGGGGGGGSSGGGGGAAGAGGVGGGPEASGGGGGSGSSSGPSATAFAASKLAQGLVRITYVTRSAANPVPAVRISTPRSGASVPGRGLVVSGRASDSSGVRAVALRIERLPRAAGRCTWLDPVSGLGRASCSAPPSLSATLRSGGAWSYRVPARIALPAGRYRVTAYGADETGIYGNSARAAVRSVTFAVRR